MEALSAGSLGAAADMLHAVSSSNPSTQTNTEWSGCLQANVVRMRVPAMVTRMESPPERDNVYGLTPSSISRSAHRQPATAVQHRFADWCHRGRNVRRH